MEPPRTHLQRFIFLFDRTINTDNNLLFVKGCVFCVCTLCHDRGIGCFLGRRRRRLLLLLYWRSNPVWSASFLPISCLSMMKACCNDLLHVFFFLLPGHGVSLSISLSHCCGRDTTMPFGTHAHTVVSTLHMSGPYLVTLRTRSRTLETRICSYNFHVFGRNRRRLERNCLPACIRQILKCILWQQTEPLWRNSPSSETDPHIWRQVPITIIIFTGAQTRNADEESFNCEYAYAHTQTRVRSS